MKTEWTEEGVCALPEGEHDYFERKSGALYEKPSFREDLAKAISAFANSGGGHILLGVQDDGCIDGVPEKKGNTPLREHIEQIIPNLVEHPLATFRVHTVIKSCESQIPKNKDVIVIDVGESPHAPHQARHNKTYYYRPGGRSEPAPHFYLEALRNRAITPVLTATPIGLKSLYASSHDDGIFLQVIAAFKIENSGKNLARHWLVSVECKNTDMIESGAFRLKDFPNGRVRVDSMRINKQEPLLPSLSATFCATFGLNLKPDGLTREAIQHELDRFLGQDLAIVYSVVCESTRSEEFLLEKETLRTWLTADNILWALPSSEDSGCLYGGHGLFCNYFNISRDRVGSFHDVICNIENRTGPDYLDVDVAFIFYDNEGRIIHVEKIYMKRLPHGVKRQTKFSLDFREIKDWDTARFVYLSDSSIQSSEFVRPFGEWKEPQ